MGFLRRLGRRLTRQRVPIVYHPDLARAYPGIPLDPGRGEKVLALLHDEGLLGRRDPSRPTPASMDALLRVHDAPYLESLDRTDVVSRAFGVALTDTDRQRMLDVQRLATGGTIQTFRLARRGRKVAVNLGGGFHHAAPGAGMAFCLFNDIAVGIAHLREYGMHAPVLVVDLDVHDGNGTRAAFADDPTVYTLSIHNQDWAPAGGVASTSVALGTGVTDDVYLDAVRETLPPIVASHAPGFVVYVAGTDPAADDRIGDWRITPAAMLERDRFVIETVRGRGGSIPVGVVLAGGYGQRAWRYTARFVTWLMLGSALDPPNELELAVRRFRARAVQPYEGGRSDDWGLTEEDLFAVTSGAAGEARVLGVYSRHGIELSLERAGLLEQFARRGFASPTIDVSAGSGLGETIRVYGDVDRTELVMELRVNRSTSAVSGMELLYVEWLLLQNPRAAFTDTSPRLPGQEHPGLGMLREVLAWLVVLCETLGLDGMAFAPAQYYMAVLGRHHMRFVDPEAAARFEAMYAALRHLPLHDATRALDEGRLIDERSGEAVRWEGMQQVYPVSNRLKALSAQPPATTGAYRYRLID